MFSLLKDVKDEVFSTTEFIYECDIPYSRVQSFVIILIDILCYYPPGLLQIRWRFRMNALARDRLMPPFDFVVGLREKGEVLTCLIRQCLIKDLNSMTIN
jgi:hypothetical protein